jgi:hypothetical protein
LAWRLPILGLGRDVISRHHQRLQSVRWRDDRRTAAISISGIHITQKMYRGFFTPVVVAGIIILNRCNWETGSQAQIVEDQSLRYTANRGELLERLATSPGSNPSLSSVEPVSVRDANSCREKVGRGQRPGRDFGGDLPILPDRDWPLSGLSRQSPGKLKTIPPASGNRNCAGLRGGAGRTQTSNQPIMWPKGNHKRLSSDAWSDD